MTTGPDGQRRPPEPTFADVMNGFSFDSGRSSKRRRWGRKRDEEPKAEAAPPVPEAQEPGSVAWPVEPAYPESGYPDAGYPPDGYREAGYDDGYANEGDPEWTDESEEGEGYSAGAAVVRPYAWTKGRTKSGYHLEIETLVLTSQRGHEQLDILQFEHRSVAELCERARSVAEVAAMLAVPLGVAKVLLGDMAGLGLVTVHQTVSGNGDVPDLALMERVLSGLRRL